MTSPSVTPEQATREVVRRLAKALLVRSGFEAFGPDAWIRDDEGCDTVYDTAWALERIDLPNLADAYGRAGGFEAFVEAPDAVE